MPNDYTVQSFANATRQKFPGSFDDLDDRAVTNIILSQYPEYKTWISDYDTTPQIEEDYDPDLVDYAKNLVFTGMNIGTGIPSALVGVAAKGLRIAEDITLGGKMPAFGETAEQQKAKVQESYNALRDASEQGVNPLTGEKLPWYKKFLSDTFLGISEDLRKWSDGYMDQWIEESPDLQAYMAYNQTEEGEYSWENVLKHPFHLAMRGVTELAPTVAATITAGLYGGPAAAIAVGGLMEGSGAYNEGMRYMTEELGLSVEDANSIASATSLVYGSIAGVIEKFQAGKVARQLGIGDEILEESFTKALYKKIVEKAGQEFKEEGLSKGISRVLSSADLMETMITEGAQEMTQATMDLAIANTYKKYADKEGNISFNDMARNLADDLYEAATSDEAKDSFFSAMMGTSAPGGARRAFDYTTAKLKSDGTELDKDKNTKFQDDTAEPISVLPPVVIKDDSDYFKVLYDEIDTGETYGKHSKMVSEDADIGLSTFITDNEGKGKKSASEAIYSLYEKGLSDGKSRDEMFSKLTKEQRVDVEGIIADEFILNSMREAPKTDSKLSEKAKAIIGESGTVFRSKTDKDVKNILALIETEDMGEKKDILKSIWKEASEQSEDLMEGSGLSDKEIDSITDDWIGEVYDIDAKDDDLIGGLPEGAEEVTDKSIIGETDDLIGDDLIGEKEALLGEGQDMIGGTMDPAIIDQLTDKVSEDEMSLDDFVESQDALKKLKEAGVLKLDPKTGRVKDTSKK